MTSFAAQFDSLHEQAMQATGLQDFGSSDYQAPLRLLLQDYDRYARFGAVGQQLVSADAIGNLAGRLIEEQGFKDFPEYADTTMERPLIIIGMTRTGTTTLHRLMALDPALQMLPLWLACTPMPRPPRHTWEGYPGFQQIAQSFEHLYAMSPLFKQMHPQHPAAADECRIAINHSFWSPGNMGTSYAGVRNYIQWCFETDPRAAYRRYRRVLGLISGGSRKRWLLKDPCHIRALPALMEAFPDACIVFTHRDPIEAMVSFGNLICHARQLCEPDFRPAQIKDTLPGYWGKALARLESDRAKFPSHQILDLHFDQITRDPIGSIEAIYRHFDIPLSDSASSLWRQSISADPRGGHGSGKLFGLADFGLTRDEIHAGIGAYLGRYRTVDSLASVRR